MDLLQLTVQVSNLLTKQPSQLGTNWGDRIVALTESPDRLGKLQLRI
jgi:hypothetical protein